MNGDRLGGVLLIAAAGGIAWAFFTGRLDGAIAEITARASHAATSASSGFSGFTKGASGEGAGGGRGGGW